MCKIGDIILVDGYIRDGEQIGRHSFVVLSDEKGQIQGLDYDIVCNVMSSFHSEEHKRKKLSYKGNFPIASHDTNATKKDGYIKAEQFYYFDKSKTDFIVIGNMVEEVFNRLIDFIESLDIEIEHVVDNL